MSTDLTYNKSFPTQKRSESKKTKKWGIQCIEAAEDLALFKDPLIRQSFANKLANYNLYNDILDTKDIEKACNPFGFDSSAFPAKMQNYPIVVPKIDVLVGEERRRRFDYQVRVLNDEAISEKERNRKEEYKKFITSHVTKDEPINKPQLEAEIDNFKSYMNYEWQDHLERRSRHILNYLYQTRNLKEMFSRGFEDVLVAGEEVYCVDIENGHPTVRKCNTLNVHTIRSGESPWVDDADIIIEDGYYSHGQILDKYYSELTDKQVDLIERGFGFEGDDDFISIGETERNYVLMDELLDTEAQVRSQFADTYDNEGNIRVMRVVWKSKRKVGILKYADENGNQFEKIVDEKYKKKAGDDLKWVWISEWWEGTRIGGGGFGSEKKSIYIKIKKRPIQFRSIHNLSKCSSGYIGLAYNTNTSKSKSLMDRMKPYQYLYNIFMYRTELAFARAKGKIGKISLSKMPDKWTPKMWMQYAEVNGWLIEDDFNEVKRGSATGKLAGQMSSSSTAIDLEMGNYIQQHLLMLQFLEEQLGQIAGISRQREGNIEQRETVRGVERAVSQSNLITEKYFGLHDMVKIKVMGALLETAKVAWKGKKQILSYVSDDLTDQTFTIEANDPVMDCDAGVILTNGENDAELMNALRDFAHAGLQTDKISFKEIFDIYMNPSIAATRRRLEQSEQKKEAQQRDMQAQQERINEAQLKAAEAAQKAAQDFEMSKIDKEYQYKMQIESLKSEAKKAYDLDRDNDGIADEIELAREQTKSNVALLKAESEKAMLQAKLVHESQENEKDRKHKMELEKLKNKSKPKN